MNKKSTTIACSAPAIEMRVIPRIFPRLRFFEPGEGGGRRREDVVGTLVAPSWGGGTEGGDEGAGAGATRLLEGVGAGDGGRGAEYGEGAGVRDGTGAR